MNKKEYYQKIFEEYQLLKIKTQMGISDLDDKHKYKFNYIDPADLSRRNELKKELKGNMEFLTDKQLKDLYKDDGLMDEAVRIIVQGKLKNN